MTATPTPIRTPPIRTQISAEQARQGFWLAGGLLLAFLVPFIFADLAALPRDGYYAIYSLAVFAFFATWIRASHIDVRAFVAGNWKWAVALGLLSGGLLAAIVLKGTGTAHPHGARFAAEILWRGVVYGAADGILLGSFPILAVFAAIPLMHGREHWGRTFATGVLALVAAFAFTGAYHAGYPDFRSGKIGQPLRGTAMWSAPTLLTLNPLGAPIAHITLHMTAVTHSYETDVFLPPH
jgi:hypothetical protein